MKQPGGEKSSLKKREVARIDDVASAAGVSKATVSRVMNKPHLVQKYTVDKVRRAMERLNYVPNTVAQSMRLQKTKIVAVIIPDLGNQFYSSMLKEIELELRERDYVMLICPTSGNFDEEKQYIAKVMQHKVDGVLLFTYNNSRRHIEDILTITNDVPLILMDESLEDLPVNQVVTNGYEGMREATNYLIKKGHKHIVCVGSNTEAATKRTQGYMAAIKEAGLVVEQGDVLHSGFNIVDGGSIAKQLLERKKRPSAVVCVSDSIAVGLINELKTFGISIPDDIEVIGFNNIEISTVVTPKLSTISQKMSEISEHAVAMLMELIDNPKKRSYVSTVRIEPELVLRDSTK